MCLSRNSWILVAQAIPLVIVAGQNRQFKNKCLLIIQSPELAKLTENWKNHKEHSEPYAPRD
jgi:hypothetical protein